jgi:hypothetical protein
VSGQCKIKPKNLIWHIVILDLDRQFKKKDYHAGNYKLDKTDKYKLWHLINFTCYEV